MLFTFTHIILIIIIINHLYVHILVCTTYNINGTLRKCICNFNVLVATSCRKLLIVLMLY